MEKILVILLAICIFLGAAVLIWLPITGLYYLVCLAFGLEFSWLISLIIFGCCIVLKWIFSNGN